MPSAIQKNRSLLKIRISWKIEFFLKFEFFKKLVWKTQENFKKHLVLKTLGKKL